MLTGMKVKFDISNSCKAIMQVLILECKDNFTKRAFKLKIYYYGIIKNQEVLVGKDGK